MGGIFVGMGKKKKEEGKKEIGKKEVSADNNEYCSYAQNSP